MRIRKHGTKPLQGTGLRLQDLIKNYFKKQVFIT
jgi:hypothetical protein